MKVRLLLDWNTLLKNMSEATEAIKKYFSEEINSVKYHGDKDFLVRFSELFSADYCKKYEAPDLFMKDGNELWIIEHFEFDCFSTSRKGSSAKIEQSRVDREFERFCPTKPDDIFKNETDAVSSYGYYIKNVTEAFLSRYGDIEKYKAKLVRENYSDAKSRV